MSNFVGLAFNPETGRVEPAEFCDDRYINCGYEARFLKGVVFPASDLVLIKSESDDQWSLWYRGVEGTMKVSLNSNPHLCSFRMSKLKAPIVIKGENYHDVVRDFKAAIDGLHSST